MAYLIDTDGYNYLEDWYGYGISRISTSLNGVMYMCFVNESGNLEIKRSFDNAQTWYHIITLEDSNAIMYPSIATNDDGSIIVLVYKNSSTNDIIWRTNADNFILHSFNDGGLVKGTLKYVYFDTIANKFYIMSAKDNPNSSYAEDVGIYSVDLTNYSLSLETYLSLSFSYYMQALEVTDVCGKYVICKNYDWYYKKETLAIYDFYNNTGVSFNYGYVSTSRPVIFEDYTDSKKAYIVVPEIVNEIAQLNLYEWDATNVTVTLKTTILTTETGFVEAVKKGHLSVGLDGIGDAYILYVKPEPNDYLFVTKFDIGNKSLDIETQLTSEPARCPNVLKKSLPNRSKVYYIYQRQPA